MNIEQIEKYYALKLQVLMKNVVSELTRLQKQSLVKNLNKNGSFAKSARNLDKEKLIYNYVIECLNMSLVINDSLNNYNNNEEVDEIFLSKIVHLTEMILTNSAMLLDAVKYNNFDFSSATPNKSNLN